PLVVLVFVGAHEKPAVVTQLESHLAATVESVDRHVSSSGAPDPSEGFARLRRIRRLWESPPGTARSGRARAAGGTYPKWCGGLAAPPPTATYPPVSSQ